METKSIEKDRAKFLKSMVDEKGYAQGYFSKDHIYSSPDDIGYMSALLQLTEDAKIVNTTVHDIVHNFYGDIFLLTKKNKIIVLDDEGPDAEDECDCVNVGDCDICDSWELLGLQLSGIKRHAFMSTVSNLKLKDRLNFIVQAEWPFKEPELKAIENPENEYQEYINSLI